MSKSGKTFPWLPLITAGQRGHGAENPLGREGQRKGSRTTPFRAARGSWRRHRDGGGSLAPIWKSPAGAPGTPETRGSPSRSPLTERRREGTAPTPRAPPAPATHRLPPAPPPSGPGRGCACALAPPAGRRPLDGSRRAPPLIRVAAAERLLLACPRHGAVQAGRDFSGHPVQPSTRLYHCNP